MPGDEPSPPPALPAAPERQDRPYPPYRRWLHVLAIVLAAATFLLVAIGGLVTSEEAGMAVPDGFTTFGTWSLIAPLETWWYDLGTRLEHSHRLQGYVVGSLAIALMAALFLTQRGRGRLKALGVGVLLLVILQGIMGILRVDQVSLIWAGVHGVFGQLFLCSTVLAAAAVGPVWMRCRAGASPARSGGGPGSGRGLRWLPWVMLGALFVQLCLGAAVRHSQSALAIPDWPLHYGRVIPPMSQEAVDAAVAAYPDAGASPRFNPRHDAVSDGGYHAWQVHLHLAHRLWAYCIFVFGLGLAVVLGRRYAGERRVLIPLYTVAGLLLAQVLLGILTVWSGERPSIATAHQSVGAALLAAATWLTIRMHLIPPAAAQRGAWGVGRRALGVKSSTPHVKRSTLHAPRLTSNGPGGAA